MIALYVQVIVLLAIAYLAGAFIASLVRRSLYRPALPGGLGERRVDPLPEFANASHARAAMPAPAAPPAAQIAPAVAKTAAPVVAEPAPKPAPAPVPVMIQDLKRIRQIDESTEAALAKLGVARYEHIAAWTRADVGRIADALGLGERISQENWIEQAQILAKGGETAYARRRARGEIAVTLPGSDGTTGITPTVIPAMSLRPQPSTAGAAAVVAEIIQPPMPQAHAAPTAASKPTATAAAAPATFAPAQVAERAAFAIEHPRIAVPVRPAPAAAHDELMRIGHIDAAIATALHDAGIVRYADIAAWSQQDVERIGERLGIGNRIARENWIEQAQILSRGGDTAYSRQFDRAAAKAPGDVPQTSAAAAPAASDASAADMRKSDIGNLRSVKSDAFQPDAGEPAKPRLRVGPPDDLKRIRGIGVLIEKKLNSMGILSYEAIANWTAADIDRVSQTLDFRGRIERENWVEQARILASGGATEFSRRVDRGEVETSRMRT